MNIQCLSRVLETLQAVFAAKLLVVPQNLVLLTDNTTREQQNQHVALFLAFLVASGVFQTVTNNFFLVGHTHMKLDQRFSVAATKLASAPVLQTPTAFATHIEQHVRFQRGRLTTSMELNKGAWNWQEWLKPLGVKMSGLTPSVNEPDVCHCWRFVRRADLKEYVSPTVESQLVVPLEFSSDVTSPSDCVLLLKQRVSSCELAQPPLLVLPEARLRKLRQEDLKPAPRNALTTEAIREYRKTADRVARVPWNLHEAKAYLTEWVERNIAKRVDSPGCVNFVMKGRRSDAASQQPPPEWRNFAPRPPRVVEIAPGGGPQCLRMVVESEGKPKPKAAAPKAQGAGAASKRMRLHAKTSVAAVPADVVVPVAADSAPPCPLHGPLLRTGATTSAGGRRATGTAGKKRGRTPGAKQHGLEGPPPLGCPKCRRAPKGCAYCRNRRAKWEAANAALPALEVDA